LNRVSRKLSSFAVALNCGIGSSSLKADVNAFDRLHTVRWFELFESWFEVIVVDSASQVLGHVQFTLNECLVDDDLGCHVRQVGLPPGLHLLSHGLEIPLHAIDANRDRVNERERLRVLREDRSKHAWDDCSESRQGPVYRYSDTIGRMPAEAVQVTSRWIWG